MLVLALAGSTSPASRSAVAAGTVTTLAAPASPAPMDQAAASVTVPGERSPEPTAGAGPTRPCA